MVTSNLSDHPSPRLF